MAHLLFALAFPFKARNFMNEYSKIAHIVEVIVVFALGILPGVVVLSTSKYQIDRFPPDTCYPSVELLFYTYTLPIIIYITIGLAMLFTVFSILRRVSAIGRSLRLLAIVIDKALYKIVQCISS